MSKPVTAMEQLVASKLGLEFRSHNSNAFYRIPLKPSFGWPLCEGKISDATEATSGSQLLASKVTLKQLSV